MRGDMGPARPLTLVRGVVRPKATAEETLRVRTKTDWDSFMIVSMRGVGVEVGLKCGER